MRNFTSVKLRAGLRPSGCYAVLRSLSFFGIVFHLLLQYNTCILFAERPFFLTLMLKSLRCKNAFTLVELMMVIVIIGVLVALLLPAIQAAREVARRGQCRNKMLQVLMAVKSYEEIHGVLPPGTINETGPIRNVPLGYHIGWIPRILPFLEQVPLYNEIDFSHGVYDKENESVRLTPTPDMFICPSDGYGGSLTMQTNIKACHSGKEVPIDIDNNGVFFLNSKLRSKDIPDGTSYTVFLGESSQNSERWVSGKVIDSRSDSLGWMSGTPGTLRNTGHKVNAPPYGTFIGGEAEVPLTEPQAEPQETPEEAQQDASSEPIVLGEPEVDSPEFWAKPGNWQFYVGGFSSSHANCVNHVFGDGSARTIFETIDEKIYSLMGQRDDLQIIPLE